jgi:hypothetical protein
MAISNCRRVSRVVSGTTKIAVGRKRSRMILAVSTKVSAIISSSPLRLPGSMAKIGKSLGSESFSRTACLLVFQRDDVGQRVPDIGHRNARLS